MEKTIKISGMMCPHCEATVKNALEALNGVTSARVSHTDGIEVVTMSKEITDEVLKSTVEERGYQVL